MKRTRSYQNAPYKRPALKKQKAFYAPAAKRRRAVTFRSLEKKFFDTTVADNTAVAATGTIVSSSLCLVPDGTTESERVGRRLTISSIHMRINIRLPTTTSPNDALDVIRFILYHDKQANKLTATVALILETANYRSWNNLNNSKRFHILKDKFITINNSGGSNSNLPQYPRQNRMFNIHENCNIDIDYDGITGALTEITSSNVGVLCISNNGESAVGYIARIRFTDI